MTTITKTLTFNPNDHFISCTPFYNRAIGFFLTETSDATLISLTEFLFNAEERYIEPEDCGSIDVLAHDGYVSHQLTCKVISVDDNLLTIQYNIYRCR